ncbi:MAG: hypothetical protein M0031_13655 [Thermaerobacter sp.]|nr:hypothetical protein [Thermaerobacter sp.]
MRKDEWAIRRGEWERFAAWERRETPAHPPDSAWALGWMEDAWELAGGLVPGWRAGELDPEKVERLVRQRRILARLGGRT